MKNTVEKFSISAHWGIGRRGRDRAASVHQYWVNGVCVGTSILQVYWHCRKYAVLPAPSKKLLARVCIRAKEDDKTYYIENTMKGWKEETPFNYLSQIN